MIRRCAHDRGRVCALLMFFAAQAKSSIAQEKHLATSLHLPNAIVVRWHVLKTDVVILAPEKVG